jgi:hypothetical protein
MVVALNQPTTASEPPWATPEVETHLQFVRLTSHSRIQQFISKLQPSTWHML